MADRGRPRWQSRQGGLPRRAIGQYVAGGCFSLAALPPPTYRAAMARPQQLAWIGSGVLAFAALAAGSRWVWAQRAAFPPPAQGSGSSLWIHATPLDDRQQLLLVVDPQLRNAAVYHVDGPTGSLVLKSTRNITWDLMVGDFNAQEPKPAALRRMLEVGTETAPIGQNPP